MQQSNGEGTQALVRAPHEPQSELQHLLTSCVMSYAASLSLSCLSCEPNTVIHSLRTVVRMTVNEPRAVAHRKHSVSGGNMKSLMEE